MKGHLKSFIILTIAVLAFTFSFVGCKKNPADSKDTGGGESSYYVTLDKTALTLTEDETAVLTATTNADEKIKWDCDNKVVLSVSSGKIIAKNVGTAVVTATAGGRTASCTVTVIAQGSDGYIKTDKDNYELAVKGGVSARINATYFRIAGKDEQVAEEKNFTFESLDTSVATVNQNGDIAPVKEGKTTIKVSCDGITTSVVADVYTAAIGTPSDWLNMITSDEYINDNTKRFYLSGDIDMGGTAYNIDKIYTDGNYFSAELNGRGMSVSNITANRKISSVFGQVWGANVYDLALKNVRFGTSSVCEIGSGLADVVTTHDLNDKLDEAIAAGRTRETSFKNISLDLVFGCSVGYGLARLHYGGTFENIFVEMQAVTGKLDKDGFKAVTGGTYYWGTKGTISGVIVYAQGVLLDVTGELYDVANAVSNNHVCKSITEAAYAAYSVFDLSKWTITPTAAPILIRK